MGGGEHAVLLDGLLAQPFAQGLGGFDGSRAASERLKRATSELTGRFVDAAITATAAAGGPVRLTRYRADLVVPEAIAAECALLKAMAAHFVMFLPGTEAVRAAQRALLSELVAALAERGPDALDPVQREAHRAAGDDAGRLRVVIDQVAQLTDCSAVQWHARLCATGSPARSAP